MLRNLYYKWKVTVGYQAAKNGAWFTLNNEYTFAFKDDFIGTKVEAGESIKRLLEKSPGGKN